MGKIQNHLAGVLLAGGLNRRMGQNKALLRLSPNTPTFLELILEKLVQVTTEQWVVTNKFELYQDLKLPQTTGFVADNFAGAGPLAGLEAGLSICNYEYGLLVACDMPFLEVALLAYLAGYERSNWDALIALDVAGQPEPLCGIYRKSNLELVRAQLEHGRYKMGDFLAQIKPKYLTFQEWQAFDPNGRSFTNLNTPSDLNN